ncbi:hypothetical protein HN947_00760 [Candidatus Woesearchaeota archaeon]|jgi:hypothetical protein|nr:hypothetical protein [Candidatus Woesearchaeota archaeon]
MAEIDKIIKNLNTDFLEYLGKVSNLSGDNNIEKIKKGYDHMKDVYETLQLLGPNPLTFQRERLNELESTLGLAQTQ